MKQVEASAAAISEMMGEIARELFLDASVSHVTEGGQPAAPPQQVVSAVVGRHMDQLDATFLPTLDGYIQGASDKGAADVAEVLLLVREEVLRRLGQQLPPEMQLLEAAVGASSSEERLALLKTHALLSTDVIPEPEQQQGQPAGQAAGQGEGGSSSSSSSPALYCLAVDLERAASQVISEMELMPRIPDRRLLARLVLVREEVRQMLVESFYLQGGAPAGSPEADSLALPFRQLEAVPKADAALLQRLMALPQAPERRALLEWALQDDRERLPEPSRGAAAPPPTSFERARAEAERAQAWVRPGRFMQSLAALQQEMLEPATEAGAAAALGDAALERLESIRRAAVEVLLEMGGEGQPYLP